MPLDVPTPTAPAVIAEARARGYRLSVSDGGYGFFSPSRTSTRFG